MKQNSRTWSGLAAAALAFMASSCTTLVTLETVVPPVVHVSPEQWKVLVVNRFDTAGQTTSKNGNITEMLQNGAYQAAGGALGAVYNDSTFVLINADEAIRLPASEPLSQDEARMLHTQYRPHLILTLDKFDAQLEKQVSTYEDEDGFRSKTADFDLVVTSNWSLYDSTGTLVDRAAVQEKELYDSRAAISAGPALGKAGPVVNRLAIETGYNYWDRLYPKPQLLVRQVHLAKTLNNATLQLMAGQFEQSVSSLLPLAQDPNNKHSAKAAYNLAIAYEAAGNMAQAAYWAQQAQQKGDKLAATLIGLWTQAGLVK